MTAQSIFRLLAQWSLDIDGTPMAPRSVGAKEGKDATHAVISACPISSVGGAVRQMRACGKSRQSALVRNRSTCRCVTEAEGSSPMSARAERATASHPSMPSPGDSRCPSTYSATSS